MRHSVAQLMKTQRQKLEFSGGLEKENSQLLTLPQSEMAIWPPYVIAVSSHLIFVSSAGIKCMHHYLACKADQWGFFYSLIFRQDLFIKIQMKYHCNTEYLLTHS